MTQALVVDDNLANRYLLRMLLQGHGYTVVEACHGEEALALAHQQPPAIIISDLLMPVMDGYTLLRQWKADERLTAIPFMVYTATYTDPKDERLALDLGADAFLIKPAEPDAVLACIEQLLAPPAPTSPRRRQPQGEETALLKGYSEALFRKLNKKLEGLELTNQKLRTEIAERQRTEAALRDSEARYRQLFESIPDPVWVCDRQTLAILAVNDAAMADYGYTPDEWLALTLPTLCLTDDLAALQALVADPRPGRHGPWQCRQKDGTVNLVEISAHGLEFEGKSACLIQARDITEQRRLEEQFRQAQKMEAIGRLAGGIAHDFNNLVMVVQGYSEILQGRITPDDPAYELLGEIHRAGERAGALTRQLLAFSRQQVLVPQVLNLNQVVADTEKMLRRLIGEDVILQVELSPSLGLIKADPGQMEQVLMNLAVNARDAMPQGGWLRITTDNTQIDPALGEQGTLPPGNYVRLTVADTGSGMDSATQTKMFEPFFTTKAVGRGTGLGLATVHGIITQSGGVILVETAVGQGTQFQIYLPQVVAALPSEPELPRSRRFPPGHETVLIVEDEPAVRDLEIAILQRCGYRVLEATNGQEALQRVAQHPETIHLLVTDVVMPHMGGRELAEQVMQCCPDCRVLFLSGYTDDAILHHGVQSAEYAFLQKPFAPSTLAQTVRAVLDAVR